MSLTIHVTALEGSPASAGLNRKGETRMRQKAQHSIKGWSVAGVLLESYRYAPGPAIALPRHAHEEYQFGLSLTNVGGYHYRGAKYAAPVGSLAVIHPGEPHNACGNHRDAPSLHRMMYVPANRLRQAQVQVWGERAASWPLPFFPEPILLDAALFAMFLALHRALESSGSRLEQDSRLLSALTRLIYSAAQFRPDVSDVPSPAPVSFQHDPVRRAQEFLRAHYADNVSLDDLARTAGVSAFHLCRRFRQATGFPPHVYQTYLRLDRAKMLLTSGLSPSQVAVMVGFYDQSHFGAAFKRFVGVTPGAYTVPPLPLPSTSFAPQ